MVTSEALALIAKASEKDIHPMSIETIYEFNDLQDEALALCDLTDTTTIKELIEVLPGGFHRTELRVLLTTMTTEKENG